LISRLFIKKVAIVLKWPILNKADTISNSNQGYKMKNEYKSQDFYLCAFLMAAGVQLRSYYKENRSTVFLFEKDNKLDELIGDFYSMRASVNPVSYGQSIKNLKSIIHSNTNINSNQIQNNEPTQCYK